MKKHTMLLTAMLSSAILLSSIHVGGQFTSSEIAYADTVNPIFVYNKDGLKVTVNKVEVIENDNFKQVDIYYSQENTTSDKKLSEITFALFLEDGSKERQTGFFGDLFPSEKKERIFSKKLLKTQNPMYLEIDTEFLSESVDKSKIAYLFENSTANSETLNSDKNNVDNTTVPKVDSTLTSNTPATEKDKPDSVTLEADSTLVSSTPTTEREKSDSAAPEADSTLTSSTPATEREKSDSAAPEDNSTLASSTPTTERDKSDSVTSEDNSTLTSSTSITEKDKLNSTVLNDNVKEVPNQHFVDKSRKDVSAVSSNKGQKLNSSSNKTMSPSKKSSTSVSKILPKTSAVK